MTRLTIVLLATLMLAGCAAQPFGGFGVPIPHLYQHLTRSHHHG